MCPETGTINYIGRIGTNMWVVPVNNAAYNINIDPVPFENTHVSVNFITEVFKIDHYKYGREHLEFEVS